MASKRPGWRATAWSDQFRFFELTVEPAGADVSLLSKAVNSPRNNGPELLAEHATTPGEGGGPNPA
jgi:hypothetical protein